jgi:hypothetical protein
MHSRVDDVLQVLDDCCAAYAFPLLDNGYVYPAAARLSLHHSNDDWAIVIETFGYAPREGTPSTIIQTFASRLVNRKSSEQYVNRQAYQNYLAQHPHNEFRSVYPFDDDWEAIADEEGVAQRTQYVSLRGARMNLPTLESYATLGIDLENRPRVQIFELCRAIADLRRNDVLATIEERRHNLDPTLREILVLDEWRHPEFIEQNEKPSDSEAFQQLALAVVTGDRSRYRPTLPPNTHWRNWLEAGML